MKFYSVKVYNKQGQYCGHHCQVITDTERIEDFNEPEDRVSEITREDFESNPPFYRTYSDAARKAWCKEKEV